MEGASYPGVVRFTSYKLVLLAALSLLGLGLLIDFSFFISACYTYGVNAQTGVLQLKDRASAPSEVLVVLTGDRNRIARAFELLESRKSSKLIISGAGKGATLVDLLNKQGGTFGHVQNIWDKTVVDSSATSTLRNAIETERILLGLAASRLILITSDYHMRRALSIFRSYVNVSEVIPYAVHSEVTDFLHGESWDFFDAVPKVLLEYWKDLAYRLGLLRLWEAS